MVVMGCGYDGGVRRRLLLTTLRSFAQTRTSFHWCRICFLMAYQNGRGDQTWAAISGGAAGGALQQMKDSKRRKTISAEEISVIFSRDKNGKSE